MSLYFARLNKFLIGALGAIAGSGIISYMSFSRAAERQSLDSLRTNAIGLAEGTAFMIAPLIAFESVNEMNKILDGLTRNPDVVYAVICDQDHKSLATNGGDAPPHHDVVISTKAFVQDGLLHVVTPAVDSGEDWGYFHLGVSLDRMNEGLNETRTISLGTIVSLSFVALLGLGWMLESMICNPLGRLTKSTDELAHGRYPNLPAKSNDEIGLLTSGFNHMSSRLEEQVAARSDLNRELVEAKERAEEAAKSSLEERNQMRTLIDNLPDYVYFKDRQSRLLINNRAYADLFLVQPLQDPMGKTDFDVLSKEAAEAYHADDQAVMRSGKPLINRREAVNDGEGDKRQLLTTKVPFQHAPGEVVGLVGISRDITKESQLEESRRTMQMQLHQAQKLESIGQLAAGIAQEINTPTQFVGDNTVFLKRAFTGLIDALNQGRSLLDEAGEGPVRRETVEQTAKAFKKAKVDYLAKQVPRAIEQSLEGLERVAKLVGAMKEFSHPSQGQKQAVDLAHTIETTLTVARNEWKYVAEVVTDFDSSLPPVPCLRDEFNQVILNMVVNAAQAVAAANGNHNNQKGTITIQTRLAGEWAEIRVSDTGTGIPLEIRQKIFDPFFTTKEVGKGTGQGLAIARSVVVDKHGGRIDVESEVGKGTTFVMRLPLVESAGGSRTGAARSLQKAGEGEEMADIHNGGG